MSDECAEYEYTKCFSVNGDGPATSKGDRPVRTDFRERARAYGASRTANCARQPVNDACVGWPVVALVVAS